MNEQNPATGPAPDELSDTLRQAVEHIRAETVPEDALGRAVERVPARPAPRLVLLRMVLAASVLIGAMTWALYMSALQGDTRSLLAREAGSVALTPSIVDASGDIGIDPDVAAGYKTRRIEEVAVPAPQPKSRVNTRLGGGLLSPRGAGPGPDRSPLGIYERGRGMGVPQGGKDADDEIAGDPDVAGAQGRLGGGMPGMPGGGGMPATVHPTPNAPDNGGATSYAINALSWYAQETPEVRAALLQQIRERNYQIKGLKQAAEERVARMSSRSASAAALGGKGKPADRKPTTWRRNGQRPTVARVYLGDGNALELVSLQVTVTVEGPRARTLVDHVFRNPHDRQLEGTFEYPLPSGASPSYFAMFLGQTRNQAPPPFARRGQAPPLPPEALASLSPPQVAREVSAADWGTLREARVVSKDKALETYEEIVRGRIDPALLEYAGGNTFSGRVFPIPPRGYNRVLFAYEELLPQTGGRVAYRFPLPDGPLSELHFTLQADATACKEPALQPKGPPPAQGGGRLLYTRSWSGQAPGGDAVFSFTPARPEIQTLSGRQGDNGPHYLYARVRPELPVAAQKPFAHHAVFLLDTSLSEHPDRFAVGMKLWQRILESDPDITQFNILAFNVGASWVEPKGWLPNTPAGRAAALGRLDGIVLEGATDLGAALDKLARPGFDVPAGTPLAAFLLSDGQVTWGEADAATLAARFEAACPHPTRFYCYRTGLGAENQELFVALTRKGGGVFQCFTEADLAAAARAHRAHCLQVESVRLVGGPAASDLLVAGRRAAVYPGGELVVAGRTAGAGRATLVVEGTFQGKRLVQEYPVEVKDGGELAARAWAEVAVASLLALNDPRLDGLVTAYCQQFGIGSRVASFLVLENDADYKRFNLEEERGRTVAGDLADYLRRAWREAGRVPSPREALIRALARLDGRLNLAAGSGPIWKLVALLTDADCDVPARPVAGALVRKADVPPGYLAARDADRRAVDPPLAEARRRLAAGDADGAVRALSSIVEEYPGRADALRLVGYRLLDMGQAAQAVGLFRRVQRARPFEPHAYRDLARSLEEAGRYGLAAVHYEVLLAGAWHARFAPSLQQVAQEEYARMMQDALRRGAVAGPLAEQFGERLARLSAAPGPADLRVTISWNTDGTDVDLWVVEPDGTKCFYQHPRTATGGELSQDQTQGYGPERYQVRQAKPGVYTVLVHYFRANPNLLAGETHVQVAVTRHAGTPQETVERHTVVLRRGNEQVEVCKVKF